MSVYHSGRSFLLQEENNYVTVNVGGVAVTNNDDNAGYYGAVGFSIPQGKSAYAARWDSYSYQGGVSFNLIENAVIFCSPVPLTLSVRNIRVYYR